MEASLIHGMKLLFKKQSFEHPPTKKLVQSTFKPTKLSIKKEATTL